MMARVAADRRWIGRAALGAVVVTGYAVIVAPLAFVSWLAFFRNEVVSFPPEGYTLRWFAAIAFGLMTATLTLSVASNVVVQRRYRR